MSDPNATIYMFSSLAMGLLTFFAIFAVLYLMVRILSYPLKFFWCEVIIGLFKRK